MELSEVVTPILFQLGIGGIGGFFMGYVTKRIYKIAIIIGIFAFSIIYLAYSNVINVSFDKLLDLTTAFNPTVGLFAPLIASLPFLISLGLGFLLGFKRG